MQGFSVAGHKPDSVWGDHLSRPPVARSARAAYPAPLRAASTGPCFALHRTGFGEPPCHHGAGGLLPHLFTLAADVSGDEVSPVGGLLSVPLSVGFRRLG